MPGGDAERRISTDVEADYFQSVEEFFVARRGDPLFLSSADWNLVRGWRKQGIPLRVVLRGIADALDVHAHSWSRGQAVGSLAYCAAEVDAAAERWRRAVGEEQPGLRSPSDQLSRLSEALLGVTGLPARVARSIEGVREALAARAANPGDVRTLEPWLSQLEARVVRALIRGASDRRHLARLEASVDADLAPYRERMPHSVLAQVRRESVARLVLGLHGLPRLSLIQADRE
jgi:hypothetical protein